jgi:putative transposase
MDRTIVVQLNPTNEQAHILARTLREHTECFNAVARLGFASNCSNGVELHKDTYKATEAVKSALTWQKKHAARYPKLVATARKRGKEPPTFKPVRSPQSKSAPIRYDQRSYWVKWETLTASLATVAGRVELSFTVPEHAHQYIGGNVCSADLCMRKGRYFLSEETTTMCFPNALCKRLPQAVPWCLRT